MPGHDDECHPQGAAGLVANLDRVVEQRRQAPRRGSVAVHRCGALASLHGCALLEGEGKCNIVSRSLSSTDAIGVPTARFGGDAAHAYSTRRTRVAIMGASTPEHWRSSRDLILWRGIPSRIMDNRLTQLFPRLQLMKYCVDIAPWIR